MLPHIDYNDPTIKDAAAEVLRRHERHEPEANITTAVRDFLVVTGLVRSDEIGLEEHPALGSRRAVDLTALDTFMEFKRRIGSHGGLDPNPDYVRQLDDYLEQSDRRGRVRMGVLTDGKHWLLRWPHAGPVKTTLPYAFTFDDPDRWFNLFEWLRDNAFAVVENKTPSRETIPAHFGPNSPHYQRDITRLTALYREHKSANTIRVKTQLWQNLLIAALGEVASTPDQMDDLFVRHTYLTAVIGMVVQASFGIDVYGLAETNPADLLYGREFRSNTGLQGVVESDFFAWPTEVEGGLPFVKTLARRVARFDWQQAPNDVASILYETVIPPDERRQLGEYYTPDWLARTMVREVVTNPLDQTVLDPACGSGTFVAEAVTHLIETARDKKFTGKDTLDRLRVKVSGIDVHPVAVHLARAAWVLAAQPAIQDALDEGFQSSITVPIYLGDSLQLRFRTGDMFAEHDVTIQVNDEQNTELVFPVSLVERAEDFDELMGNVSEAIERDEDPFDCLGDNGIKAGSREKEILEGTIDKLQTLHREGRNHIWAYYTRNLVRPVALSRSKVNVVIGNPPWLNYNRTVSTLRTELERQSKDLYGIWQGGRYATHQDVAGLFFARCVDLYLKDGGVIGMVMPHSALQTGQYAKWRTGTWRPKRYLPDFTVNFGFKMAWDLEGLEPNDFFPVPASVVFAQRTGAVGDATPLVGRVERWLGKPGFNADRTARTKIVDTSVESDSFYARHSRLGAILYPRCLLFVNEIESPTIIQAGQTVTVNPRRGPHDKRPWRDLDLTAITGQTVEKAHVFDVHLGETVVPYLTRSPLKAVLPLRKGEDALPIDKRGVGGVSMGGLRMRMRERWKTMSALWEEHKSSVNKLDLLGQFDYWGHLSAQASWFRSSSNRPIRLVYTKSGIPTAALIDDHASLVDHTLFWITCKNPFEAHYLLAIINSDALYQAVGALMPKGQFGARHLHKHLWKLPIPEFDADDPLHAEISDAGRAAAAGAAQRLSELRAQRGDNVSVTIARRELRAWLRTSPQGAAAETTVTRLLAG